MTITLTRQEMLLATKLGCDRHITSYDNHSRNPLGRTNWTAGIEQAASVLAVENAFGYPHSSWAMLHFVQPDIPPDWVVKWLPPSRNKPPRMRITKQDSDGMKAVLVVGCNGEYRIVGWYAVDEARNGVLKYSTDFRTGRKGYWVSESKLNPLCVSQ